MYKHLKILMLEDSAVDAEIIQQSVLKKKPNCEFRLVMTEADYTEALDQFEPDVILSDNTLPQFNATEALGIFNQRSMHIPFILVTGTVSEEFAAGIIILGADDYILKDRLVRLPGAIDAALAKRRVEKEITDYKYALDQTAIVAITDQKGIIIYANDNFCNISKYTAEELIGQDHRIINSGHHPASYISELWATITNGRIWRGEFRNRAKDKNIYWVDKTIIPFMNNRGKPYQYLSIGIDISEKKMAEENIKRMEKKILGQKIQEQKKISRAIIKAQEEEKNHIGQELHDNINQILAGTKMYLHIAARNNEAIKEILKYPMELIDSSIQEIRLLSHKEVTPLKDIDLEELVRLLLDNSDPNSITKRGFTYAASNELLSDDLKLNIYRIIQEQINNILKHAAAKTVNISIKTLGKFIVIQVTDDGKGFNVKGKRAGIGISNMINRVESYNGKVVIHSSPGNGCKISVKIPY